MMSRSILVAAAALAAFAQTPAIAQDDDTSITVRAPALPDSGEPKNSASPARQLAANVRVETYDLDLRTAYGRAVLDRRIRVAADVACDKLDMMESSGVGAAMNADSGDCRHLATRNAAAQRRVAIALAD